MKRWIGGLAFALVMTMTFSAGCVQAAEEGADRGPEIGSEAPDFTLEAVGGGEVTLSELRGQPVVMVFFRGAW
jgi:cytochrome oxidase Cu insertion factor (SCO1/SenC/PrrC family)